MQHDALWLSEEEREQFRRAENDQHQQDEDLAAVLNMPEGRRVFLRLLRRWGAESPVPAGAEELHNEAEYILRDAARVHPKACMALIAALRDIII